MQLNNWVCRYINNISSQVASITREAKFICCFFSLWLCTCVLFYSVLTFILWFNRSFWFFTLNISLFYFHPSYVLCYLFILNLFNITNQDTLLCQRSDSALNMSYSNNFIDSSFHARISGCFMIYFSCSALFAYLGSLKL